MTQRLGNANSTDQRQQRWRGRIAPCGSLVSTLTWIHAWGNDALRVLAAVSALLFLYGAAYSSPNARVIAAQQRHDAIEHESRDFCVKHGIAFGTRKHTLCAADWRTSRLMSTVVLLTSHEFSDAFLRRTFRYLQSGGVKE